MTDRQQRGELVLPRAREHELAAVEPPEAEPLEPV
jgi:hypothetical protein